jgi:hypothetical protein
MLFLLTGYEGNRKSIDPEISTIARGEAECNSWYQGVNRRTIPRIHSQWVFYYTERDNGHKVMAEDKIFMWH